MSVDKYPPPNDRWIKIGKNAYILPRHKMTKEEKKSLNMKVKKLKTKKIIKSIMNNIIENLISNIQNSSKENNGKERWKMEQSKLKGNDKKELNVKDCDVFEHVCDFGLNKDNSKKLWTCDFQMSKEKLNDKRGRVYILSVDDIVKKIGQTDDNSGIKNVAGYGVGNGGKPSDRTTGIHYYIGKQLLNHHKVSMYCVWCPVAEIISKGFNHNDEDRKVIGSFSAKDLEKDYIELYIEKFGRKPELNLQEDSKSWDNSIQEINQILKSKNKKYIPEDIEICDDYWKLYHWKHNGYDLKIEEPY